MNKVSYRTYCFEHNNNIMFFYYNHNHPINSKNYKFQLGKIKIFTDRDRVLSCQVTSTPHLNLSLDWNQEYFAKLFHGLARFQLQGSGDEYDDTLTLLVRDLFQEREEIFLMRAKLADQFGYDFTQQFWNVFKNYNTEKSKVLDAMQEENRELALKSQEQLKSLVEFQSKKQAQKDKLKGQLSALLREKQAKLKQFNENFNYLSHEQDGQPTDLAEQKQSLSIAGSLFQQSQQFYYP